MAFALLLGDGCAAYLSLKLGAGKMCIRDRSQIVPFLSTLKGVFSLRGDSGMRAEVYFVNAKAVSYTHLYRVLPMITRS